MSTYPPTGANYQNHFIGVQSVVIDSAGMYTCSDSTIALILMFVDRLWVLDTGRVMSENGTVVPASYGGPKLVGINLTNNTVFQTIVFSTTAAPADSYLNDVRFDLRPNITASGKGVAYITDSSLEGRTGLITVDLVTCPILKRCPCVFTKPLQGTGEAWRHLDMSYYVQHATQFLAYVWGRPLYSYMAGQPASYLGFGVRMLATDMPYKCL